MCISCRSCIIFREEFLAAIATTELLSTVVGEAHLEFLACEEDTALHCSERKIHLLGDFVVFVTGHVHREGDAVFVGEFVDCV